MKIILLLLAIAQNPSTTNTNKYPQLIAHDFTAQEAIVLQKDFELVQAYYEELTGNNYFFCPDLHVFHVDPQVIEKEYLEKGKANVLADYLNNKARINRAGLSAPRKTAAIHEITHHFNHCNGIYGDADETIAQGIEKALEEDLYEASVDSRMQGT